MNKIILTIILLYAGLESYSQTITTTAGAVTSCPSLVTIPITVENFDNVASISLTLDYSGTKMNYLEYKNPNPELASGTFLVNGITDKVIISWFSLTAIQIGSGTLVELEFDYFMEDAELKWDTINSGNCQYSDPNLDVIPANFIDGGVISALKPPALIFPQDQSVQVPVNSLFKWSESHCSPSYRLQISKDSVFTDIIVAATGLNDTNYDVNNLEYNTTYFWRVNASITLQTTAWSDTAKFSTKEPPGIFEYNNTHNKLNLSISPIPVHDQAMISFELPEPGHVSIIIYNISGMRIFDCPVNERYNKGSQNISLNLSELPHGLYICELNEYCNKNVYSQKTKIIVK